MHSGPNVSRGARARVKRLLFVCLNFLFLNLHHGVAQVVINEVMTSNSRALFDEDGDSSDWIELLNQGPEAIDLEGYGLSDSDEPGLGWIFASLVLEPNDPLLVFASGKDRQVIKHTARVEPNALSGLSLWLVASDVELADGEDGQPLVSAWRDRSEASITLRSQGTQGAPVQVLGAPNGSSVVRFGDRNLALVATDVPSRTLASEEELSLIIVQRTHAPRDTGSSLLFETRGGRRINVHAPWSDGVMYFDFGRVSERGRMAVAPPGGFLGEWRILSFIRSSDGRGQIFVNGALLSEGTLEARLDPEETGTLGVGAFGYRGDIAEIVAYDSALVPEQRSGLEQYLSAKYAVPIRGGRPHTDFKLKARGERLRLLDPEGAELDSVPAIQIPVDQSYGRKEGASGARAFFQAPSPEAPNAEIGFESPMALPVLSHESGFYRAPFELQAAHVEASADLRYTLDGSNPSLESAALGRSIEIGPDPVADRQLALLPTNPSLHRGADGALTMPEPRRSEFGWITPGGFGPQAIVVKVRAFSPGHLPSGTVTRTFFVGHDADAFHGLPVVSVALDPVRWFDDAEGFYRPGARYDPSAWSNRYWGTGNYFTKGRYAEAVAQVEVFSEGSVHDLGRVGLRLHGGGSRAQPQKALRLVARGALGAERIDNDSLLGSGLDGYRHLLLRNAGQDSAFHPSLIRDSVIQAAAPPAADPQLSRPVVCFINGEYWGLHQLQEHANATDLRERFELGDAKLDLIEGNGKPRAGDADAFHELMAYAESDAAGAVTAIFDRIDVESFVDHFATQIFFDNTDWPGNNIACWRMRGRFRREESASQGKATDGRWRWILFGTEAGLGLGGDVEHDAVARLVDLGQAESSSPAWSTALFRKLLESAPFRFHFLTRFASLMNDEFHTDRMLSIIREQAAAIQPLISSHSERWGRPASLSSWETEIDRIEAFVQARSGHQREHLISAFGLRGTADLDFEVVPAEGGEIRLQGVSQAGNPLSWNADSGVYFEAIPLSVLAAPAPGFRFVSWSGDGAGTSSVLFASPVGQQVYRAHFEPVVTFRDWEIRAATDSVEVSVSIEGLTSELVLHWQSSTDLRQWELVVPDRLVEEDLSESEVRLTALIAAPQAGQLRKPTRFFRVQVDAP